MAFERLHSLVRKLLGDSSGEAQLNELISNKIRWSSLAVVGQSWPVKLMILIPFLGYILLFNEYVELFFRFSTFFLKDIGANLPEDEIRFSTTNLYLTYFGMCSFGLGSIFFSLFCPYEIKRYHGIMDYVDTMDLDKTPVLAKSNLQFILDQYFKYEDSEDFGRIRTGPEYPSDLDLDFYNLISEMFRESEDDYNNDIHETGEPKSSASEASTPNFSSEESIDNMDDLYQSMYTGSGYPNIHEIARMVWGSPKVIWAFTLPFKSLSPKFAKDIAFVKYKNLDCQSYKIRLFIMAAYLLGFMLLSVPTIITFLRLSIGIFRA